MQNPIRIFIGTSANGEDAEAEITLEYTLKKNCKELIQIEWMRQSKDTNSIWNGWKTNNWSTPFSGFRWGIVEACNFEGRAIYMDVDIVNLHDISELFNTDMKGKPVLGKPYNTRVEMSVMLIDCAEMQKHTPSLESLKLHNNVPQFMTQKINNIAGKYDTRWNVIDGENYKIDEMYNLHFSKMSSQPWHPKWFTGQAQSHARPELQKLWFDLRDEAKAMGYNPAIDYEPFGKYDIVGNIK
jgi:hypothetical protein